MDSEAIEIQTSVGKLRGLVKTSFGSTLTYYSFQGIPYGKPPIGDLRFKTSEPYGNWEDILDATKEGNDPVQINSYSQKLVGEEDCLYLNVYTPQMQGDIGVKKAVMVFIFGGSFSKGSGSTESYGPDFLVDEDIILVTINYRLGALGFLSLENENAPGNMGLKDQVLALQWIQDNISSFGGDPNNVTLFGESSGAASVHFHMLSPLSRGLFHKAILQSGNSLCQWALQTKPREKALLLASLLGCDSQDDETVLKFLQSVPARDIVKHQTSRSLYRSKELIHRLNMAFIPCLETAGENSFLSEYPRKIMERGEFSKVPVIMGITDKEGLLTMAVNEVNCERVNEDISLMVPLDLNIPAGSEEEKALGRDIMKFYLNKVYMSNNVDDIIGYVDFFTDVQFSWGNEETRQLFLKHMSCPVYSYIFTYVSQNRFFTSLVQRLYPSIATRLCNSGSCHTDDLSYLFKAHLPLLASIAPSSTDYAFRRKLTKAWTTFAKKGNPNCRELGTTWQPDSIQSPTFVDMGKTWKVTNGTFSQRRIEFWRRIYDKYSYLY